VEYVEAMSQEINDFHREDYFLAQIAAEIRRSYVKNPKAVQLKTFLHKFKVRAETVLESSIERSKAFWKATTGTNEEK